MRLIDAEQIGLTDMEIIMCDGNYKKALEMLIDKIANAPSIDAVPQWIPCSESLPEEYGNYLITTHDGNVDIGTIDPKKKSVWSACDADGFYWLREVVAWMPLPKPYERKEE